MGKVKLMFALSVISIAFFSCSHAPYVMPESQRTNDPNICFEQDILPIFVSNCTQSRCHNAQSNRAGYTLDSYANIMKRGIIPGNIAASSIWSSMNYSSGEGGKMPKDAAPLTAVQLDLISRWIVAGAVDSGACANRCDTANFTYSTAIAPMMQTYCVGCHNSASAPGGSLADYASVRDAAVNGRMIGSIEQLSGYNAMPTSGAKLSDCQITQVQKWVAAGAPNN